jgi:putative tricarboxylic transport membrane protein
MTLNKKSIFPLFVLVVSVIYLIEAIRMGAPVVDAGIRPSFVPQVLGALSTLFSLILTIKSVREQAPPDTEAETSDNGAAALEDASSIKPAVLTIVAISIYIALFTTLGYVLSSMVFVFAIIVIFSAPDRWHSKLATSAAIVAFGYVVFEQLFGVRLPTLWG